MSLTPLVYDKCVKPLARGPNVVRQVILCGPQLKRVYLPYNKVQMFFMTQDEFDTRGV